MLNLSGNSPAVKRLSAAGPLETIQIAGSAISVRRWGSGPSILCLHAIGHGSGDFSLLADRMQKDFQIVALDWPGHGHSPSDGVPPSAGHYAGIALEVCEKLGLNRPIILGNSIGGAAALIAAHQYPERIRALVLCDSGGLVKPTPAVRFIIGMMVGFFGAGSRNAFWYERAFRYYYSKILLPSPSALDQREKIIAAGKDLAPVLMQAWEGFRSDDAYLGHITPDINLPVWIAWAKSDRIIPWSRSKKAARMLPDHMVTMFTGGHSAFLEDPDRFAAELTGFVKRLI